MPVLAACLLMLALPAGEAAYAWSRLRVDGGGWVTGQVLHPAVPGLVYARTDVGGIYRRQPGESAWTQLVVAGSGVDGRSHGIQVESIGVSPAAPDRLYAWVGQGTGAGFYRSEDRGASFVRLPAWGAKRALPNDEVRSVGERIAVDPARADTVWVGTREDGVWYTHDAGATWAQVPTATIGVGALDGGGKAIGNQIVRFDPTSPVVGGRTQRIYATANAQGFFRSDDAGATWTRISGQTGAPTHLVTVSDAEIASDGTLYLTAWTGAETGPVGGGVWRYVPGASAAAGAWTNIRPPEATRGQSYDDVAVDPLNPARIWVIRSGGRDLHRSADRGATWTSLNNWRPGPVSSPDAAWINAAATQEAAVPQSTVWSWLSVGDLSCDADGTLWLSEGFGLWRFAGARTASASAWSSFATGIEETVAYEALRVPGGPLVTATADLSGFRWSDATAPADRQLLGYAFSSTTDLEVFGGAGGPILYAVSSSHHAWGAGSSSSGWSADGGATWTRFATVLDGGGNVLNEFGDLAVSGTDPDVLVWAPAGRWWESALLYRSADRGASWLPVTKPWPGGIRIDMWTKSEFLCADPVAADTFYLYHRTEGLYRSSDGGATWTLRSGQLPDWGWGAGGISCRPGVAGELWYCAGTAGGFRNPTASEGGGLWRSQDGGATWSRVATIDNARELGWGAALPGRSVPAIYVHGLHAGVEGIYRSGDLGATWERLALGAPLGLLDDIASVDGDAEVPGQVIVGFAGSGFIRGVPAAANRAPVIGGVAAAPAALVLP